MAIAVLYREESREYDFGPGHPLRGDRFEIFARFLKQRLPEGDNYRFVRAEPATEEDLLLICNKDYVAFNRDYFKATSLGLPFPNPERFFRYHSGDNLPAGRTGKIEEAARLIVGQVKMAADLVLAGKYQKTVCIGGNQHHAKPDYGEGFCIYNDNAFAGKYLMGKYGLDRILILDTDAHAGNGTAEYFYEEPRVLFIDLHQDPATLYPGTGSAHEIGAGRGKGFTINIPLPVHAGYDSYRLALEAVVEPVTQEFRPQIIIRNGGSDPHFADELTSLGLTVSGFRMIGEKVRSMAKVCQGRVIDILGSGYNKTVLPYAWLALVSGLANFSIEVEEPVPVPRRIQADTSFEDTRRVIEKVKGHLKDYWQCLR